MDRALAILREKRDVLERSARKLSEKETLDENDLAALVPAAQRAADQSRGGVAAKKPPRASLRFCVGVFWDSSNSGDKRVVVHLASGTCNHFKLNRLRSEFV